jgi:uncharacterized protein YfaS (alpha-2-macroglobulin family)
MIIKTCLKILCGFILAIALSSCGLGVTASQEVLPQVTSLAPPSLPDWITQISPLGDGKTTSQIRVIFKTALIPIEKLESPEQQNILAKFGLYPAIPGQFRFLTPRMVGFQAARALPSATRFQVTLKAGLGDLQKHHLDKDINWTFNTPQINLTDLPGVSPMEKAEIEPVDLQPKLQFTANTELDIASVEQHTQLIPGGHGQPIKFRVKLDKEDKQEDLDSSSQFDPTSRNWIYNLIPEQKLSEATTYTLKFSPGILPNYGNLKSDKEFVSKLATYSPLTFQGIIPYGQPDAYGTYGRFFKGSPQLEFNNILDPDSVPANIKINPAPRNIARSLQINEGDRIVGINPYALKSATTYTITIGKNLKDKFGQSLDKPVSIQYNTGDLAGDIWVPGDLTILPADKNLQLDIDTMNLPEAKYQAAYRVVKPTDLVYTSTSNDLLPKSAKWSDFKVSVKKNQPVGVKVPLREKLSGSTGMLAYGVKAHTNKYEENGQELWQEPTTYGMVQLTNLGVFGEIFPDLGIVRVHHLTDGTPVKAANIEIYQSQLTAKLHPQPIPCATGKTDESGSFQLQGENLQRCYAHKNPDVTSPELLIIAQENQDWAFTRIEEYSGAFGYGIASSWRDVKPESRGVIFSDRKLYQPGEKARLTGFADFLDKGEIKQDKNASYQVTLISPDEKKTDLGKHATNQFGTFSLELSIPKNLGLGFYNIEAKGSNGQEISGEIQVAEFKPPNFKVGLNLDKKFTFVNDQVNDKVEAQVASNYLFGSPVEGGEAKYFVTRQQLYFTPEGREEFSFGRQWFWPEESPTVSSDVLQTNAQLDADGKSHQVITVDGDLPYPMTYQVDVQVSDVSNLSVADSKTFIALPSNRLIGLKGSFVGEAGKVFPVEFVVTDPQGKILENNRVRVELQQMKYSSVTQLVEGSTTAKNQVEYKTVDQKELVSTNHSQSIDFTPPDSGTYRIRANFSDSKNESTATDLQIWVAGENPVFWGSQSKDRLEVKLNKKEYSVGETATALIQSPYPEGELYFAVIKDKPIYQQAIAVKGSAPQIQFQVTQDMLPNAAIAALLVRQGKPLHELQVGSLDNLAQIGLAPFKVGLADKYLKLQVTPTNSTLEPGREETVQLELKDLQGKPVTGQFTVMVVNESILQLSGYRPPDLVNTVYAEQPITIRFQDNRSNVVLEQRSLQKPKGWGYGGGFSNALANTRIRKDFQPLAYYNGSVLTDNDGKATVTFKLPDDLTTWRVMVVATDGNLRFGNGEATFITTKPLITNPLLPQFARPGDRLEAGLSVTNTTGNQGTLSIKGELTGGMKFEKNNSTKTTLEAKAESGTHGYRFPMIVDGTEAGEMQFNTQLNNSFSDGFAVPLEIRPLEVTEQIVETGKIQGNWLWGNQAKIPLNIDQNISDKVGGLDIQLASTLIPQIQLPAKETFANDDLPFAEPAASQMLIAANLQTLAQKYQQKFPEFDPRKQANQAFEQLQKLQLTDGGFASFPQEEKSDPWVSTYVAESLVKANQAFPNLISSATLSHLKHYLQKVLANPGQYKFCHEKLCKSQLQLNSLIALAKLGDKRNSFLPDIYQQRNDFDLVTQIKLGRYLSEFPEWEKEAKLIKSQLEKILYETGRSAIVNLPSSWKWMDSPANVQSQALRLFIQQKAPSDLIDKILQSLLDLRRNGTWETSYNNAQALTALVEYAQLQPTPPNFVAVVKLAGKQLSEVHLQGFEKSSFQVHVPMNQLPRGRNDLLVEKNGQGSLNYLVDYNYRLLGNQPGRFNDLRITREISQVNFGEDHRVIEKIGLATGDKPLTLSTGQVFDIGLEIICDRPVEHVVIKDPLAAGLEAVDQSFQTATPSIRAKSDSWELGFKTIYSDRIIAYADHLEAGVYNLHYLVRSVTPGKFLWSGSQVYLQYSPEEFGRSADSTLILEDKQ